MAIELLSTDIATSSYSEGDFSNPLCFTFDGVLGGVQEKKLYLKNTSSSSVTVSVEVTNINNNHPYDIYLKPSTVNASWTVSSNTPKLTGITIPGNSGVEYFFIKMEVVPNSSVESYDGLKIKVEEE